MRIVGGYLGGRRFSPPANKWKTRPTTDYAKEALYNILQHKLDFEQMKMLDLFGGLGNHSFEVISRGCADATYVEKFGACVKFVQHTAKELDIEDEILIVKSDALKFIKDCGEEYDYIFADPPYAAKFMKDIPDLIMNANILASEGLLVVEHDQSTDFAQHQRFVQVRQYGGCYFSFFE